MSQKCVKCGSYAINVNHHGRKPNTDTDLCDVCYWRKRADGFEGKEGETAKEEIVNGVLPKSVTIEIVKKLAKHRKSRLEQDLVRRIIILIKKGICDAMDLGLTTVIIYADEWENDIDMKIHSRLPRTVLKELKAMCDYSGYKFSYHIGERVFNENFYIEIKPKMFFKR